MRAIFFIIFVVTTSFFSFAQKVAIEGEVMSIIYANDDENLVPGVLIKDPATGKVLAKTNTYGKFSFKYDISKNRKFLVQRKNFISTEWTYRQSSKPIIIYIEADTDKYVKLTKGQAFDKDGRPLKGVKAHNSYYNRSEYSDEKGEFLIRIPNPKYLEAWESRKEAENLVITLSKEGLEVVEIRANYQSTLEDLKVKLLPIHKEEEAVASNEEALEVIEEDIDKNLIQLDSIDNLNEIDVVDLKEYISYLEDKLDHHEFNYSHAELGQSKTINKQLRSKLDTLKTVVREKEERLVVVEKEKTYLKWSIFGIILFIIPSIIAVLMYLSKRKTDKLNVALDQQNKALDVAYSDIKSSVLYAEKIQRSVMISPQTIKENFHDAFVFYRPKDIVSGDFYWFASVDGKLIIAAIDCTGHGVPGALMTMMGNSLLNEIVNISKTTSPSEILTKLHVKIIDSLQKGGEKLQDGMDASIVCISPKEQQLYFCGANNPLYFISNDELKILEEHRRGVGGDWQIEEASFKDEVIELSNIDSFYLFSDGFHDQFGGENDKKFMKKNFRNLLLESSKLNFNAQERYIQDKFEEWKGSNEQTDDILVIGIKIA